MEWETLPEFTRDRENWNIDIDQIARALSEKYGAEEDSIHIKRENRNNFSSRSQTPAFTLMFTDEDGHIRKKSVRIKKSVENSTEDERYIQQMGYAANIHFLLQEEAVDGSPVFRQGNRLLAQGKEYLMLEEISGIKVSQEAALAQINKLSGLERLIWKHVTPIEQPNPINQWVKGLMQAHEDNPMESTVGMPFKEDISIYNKIAMQTAAAISMLRSGDMESPAVLDAEAELIEIHKAGLLMLSEFQRRVTRYQRILGERIQKGAYIENPFSAGAEYIHKKLNGYAARIAGEEIIPRSLSERVYRAMKPVETENGPTVDLGDFWSDDTFLPAGFEGTAEEISQIMEVTDFDSVRAVHPVFGLACWIKDPYFWGLQNTVETYDPAEFFWGVSDFGFDEEQLELGIFYASLRHLPHARTEFERSVYASHLENTIENLNPDNGLMKELLVDKVLEESGRPMPY